jgi:hypothetical protein
MLEQLQCAIERQQHLCGNRAFVRHTPGNSPTEKPRADEPAVYVMTKMEWNALSRLERTRLYETGRNFFIMGLVIGEIGAGVEECYDHALPDPNSVYFGSVRLLRLLVSDHPDPRIRPLRPSGHDPYFRLVSVQLRCVRLAVDAHLRGFYAMKDY